MASSGYNNPRSNGFLTLLLLLFITLKLTGVIAWSWWWVLAPFWIPLTLVLGILGFALLLAWLAQRK